MAVLQKGLFLQPTSRFTHDDEQIPSKNENWKK